jgi:MFS family permease
VPTSPLVGKLTQKFGIKHTVIAAPFISIIYYIMLYLLKSYPNFILLFSAGIMGAIGSTLFWIPMNSHFALNSSHKKIAKEVSYRKILSKAPKITGPLIASVIIIYLGFPILFLIAGLIYISSLIPILMSEDYKLPLKRKVNGFFSKKNAKYSILFFVKGLLVVAGGTFLPLYIYLTEKSFIATGIVSSLVAIGIIMGAYFIGHISDAFGKHKTMRIAAFFTALIWIAVFFAEGFWLYILSIFIGFSTMALSISIMGIFCQKLKPSSCEDYMIHREMWLCFGHTIMSLAILGLISIGLEFKITFLVAAITSIFFIFYKF